MGRRACPAARSGYNEHMNLLVIQNCAAEGIGLYECLLTEQSTHHVRVHPYRGEPFPAVDDYDALIVGGTPISAYHVDEHPFLLEEWAYLAAALRLGKPCLGICFGGQLLARLLGAEVRRNPVMEIGGYEVTLTAAGRQDPLFRGFPESFPVFHWHGDTFDVPVGATLLVEGQDCRNQCFRYRNSVALQFHLEVTSSDAADWADEYPQELRLVGKTKEQVVRECRASEEEMRRLARLLLDNYMEHLRTAPG